MIDMVEHPLKHLSDEQLSLRIKSIATEDRWIHVGEERGNGVSVVRIWVHNAQLVGDARHFDVEWSDGSVDRHYDVSQVEIRALTQKEKDETPS